MRILIPMGTRKQRAVKKPGVDPVVVIAAFSEEQAERLTGISKIQLRYWDRTRFFSPSFADEDRRQAYSRVYSFRDVVCLNILNTLRNEAKVSLPHLREVKEKLAHLGDDMWAKTTLYVLNRRVIFDNPETKKREEIVTGQGILQIPLEVVRGKMADAVKLLWARDKTKVGAVEKLRTVAHNQPVVAGTRIPVRAIKNFAEAGYSVKKIIEEYPSLTPEDIQAALAYKIENKAA
jgi:uncharacterized protein (DUF433 family)